MRDFQDAYLIFLFTMQEQGNLDTIYLIFKSSKYVAKCTTQKNLYYCKKFLRCSKFKWRQFLKSYLSSLRIPWLRLLQFLIVVSRPPQKNAMKIQNKEISAAAVEEERVYGDII